MGNEKAKWKKRMIMGYVASAILACGSAISLKREITDYFSEPGYTIRKEYHSTYEEWQKIDDTLRSRTELTSKQIVEMSCLEFLIVQNRTKELIERKKVLESTINQLRPDYKKVTPMSIENADNVSSWGRAVLFNIESLGLLAALGFASLARSKYKEEDKIEANLRGKL